MVKSTTIRLSKMTKDSIESFRSNNKETHDDILNKIMSRLTTRNIRKITESNSSLNQCSKLLVKFKEISETGKKINFYRLKRDTIFNMYSEDELEKIVIHKFSRSIYVKVVNLTIRIKAKRGTIGIIIEDDKDAYFFLRGKVFDRFNKIVEYLFYGQEYNGIIIT